MSESCSPKQHYQVVFLINEELQSCRLGIENGHISENNQNLISASIFRILTYFSKGQSERIACPALNKELPNLNGSRKTVLEWGIKFFNSRYGTKVNERSVSFGKQFKFLI